ncbi:MAG: flavodoxin-dependent (E)-4-hydroxy-3-methylbut-2-enyl-diphosphate synthase [Victivallales bacterium]|nr:flavodoxin-dependent (E)-4-hydroxy-3-methylbut-2-enyl-diphosphate synthase [Victivallales bacterium]
MMPPRLTRRLRIGTVAVGGGAPVSLQSMTNTDTRDVPATLAQIRRLAAAGCDLIRVAVPDRTAVAALPAILAGSPIPVIADIHFDYRLALGAIAAGVHAVRINPGNIGAPERVRQVAEQAGAAGIPIRVGANSGSLPPGLLERNLSAGMPHDEALAEALVASALQQCRLLEEYGFTAIKVSLKASDVPITVAACRKFAARTDYPLHIGVTEAGTLRRGIIKSAAGIGALLLLGIGDTIRVSLTADPEEEVKAGLILLESLGLRDAAPEIVSCPTCGRTEIDLIGLAQQVEDLIAGIKAAGKKIGLRKIAVMGCVVNGPGEAKDADLGVAGGKGKLMLFRRGEVIGVYPEAEGWARFRDAVMSAVEN